MSQHTPGPWKFQKTHYSPEWREDTYLVETGVRDHPENGQVAHMCLEANARLIAQAPKMLNLLDRVVKSQSCGRCRAGQFDSTSICCEARALLQEIEGR